MTQPDLAEPYDPEAAADYRQQSRHFLAKSWEYLAADDLHQASEKSWGAVAWMAKAVAVTQGWDYIQHAQFGVVLRNVGALIENDRIENDRLRLLAEVAYGLHRNHYTRKRFLDAETIRRSLEDMAELLDILEPLAVPGNGQANR